MQKAVEETEQHADDSVREAEGGTSVGGEILPLFVEISNQTCRTHASKHPEARQPPLIMKTKNSEENGLESCVVTRSRN